MFIFCWTWFGLIKSGSRSSFSTGFCFPAVCFFFWSRLSVRLSSGWAGPASFSFCCTWFGLIKSGSSSSDCPSFSSACFLRLRFSVRVAADVAAASSDSSSESSPDSESSSSSEPSSSELSSRLLAKICISDLRSTSKKKKRKTGQRAHAINGSTHLSAFPLTIYGLYFISRVIDYSRSLGILFLPFSSYLAEFYQLSDR